ncbi:FAD:protein FMN transferase [Aliikangiella sp. G2MR2-5]|uniref:FAD:protein FMN transferase n=1 Tax=Aliikangiella sp. G2MR2-5 TaxID=2788943 RepID=UPI001AEDDFE7|nr:FAD:protein FMN transferase [Aliikangiella sp. G2MR2-5]
MKNNAEISLDKTDYGFVGHFKAMASPCECLIESDEQKLALQLTQIAANEGWRIEKKFSRYLKGNPCDQINQSNGQPVAIDSETFQLLSFADACYQLSDGLFDITSGVLRRAWQFKPGAKFPDKEFIDSLLPLIGWKKVTFDENSVCLPPSMEIDFGGIGKEYAVDKAAQLVAEKAPEVSVVVNFGGDLRVTCPPKNKPRWQIGVDGKSGTTERAVSLSVGAVCTSGDTERFIMHEGKRYSHILNPKTGWPAKNAPKTVTVLADQCLQAGLLSTLAILNEENAESFLQEQGVQYHCYY